MSAAVELSHEVGVAPACTSLSVSRATYYRSLHPRRPPQVRRRPARSLSGTERKGVLDVLNSERFADVAPAQVYATLLDEGNYLCAVRTMYRILESASEVRERRNQLRHPKYAKPELLATRPNEVWSWDLTKLPGPRKWMSFHLYVLLDILSRYAVGWMVAERESGTLAKRLIEETCEKEGVAPGELTVHSDRGPSMTSQTVTQLHVQLGLTKSLSRPHVSNDNPFSESQFKTLKYRPSFPERFGCLEDARAFCRDFFAWYNTEHRHSGIGYMTPAAVHHGKADALTRMRRRVLLEAYRQHPERFVRRPPEPPAVPTAVWINPPAECRFHDTNEGH